MSKPNPANYNLKNDEGKIAYNKIVDEYYKKELKMETVPLIELNLYKGSIRVSPMSFKFTG